MRIERPAGEPLDIDGLEEATAEEALLLFSERTQNAVERMTPEARAEIGETLLVLGTTITKLAEKHQQLGDPYMSFEFFHDHIGGVSKARYSVCGDVMFEFEFGCIQEGLGQLISNVVEAAIATVDTPKEKRRVCRLWVEPLSAAIARSVETVPGIDVSIVEVRRNAANRGPAPTESRH